jgi:hypothetical protein
MRQPFPFTFIVRFALPFFFFAVSAIAAEDAVPPASANNGQALIGKWLRPDGGYVLQISDPAPDGKLAAAYFNPRPINISRAAWRFGGGRLQIFVELRDQGYPGATYILHYDPENDQLLGKYTQPAAQQTFDVVFTRLPAETE